MKLDKKIIEEMRKLVGAEGFELLETEVTGAGSRMILRLVIDSPTGVNLDQCAAVSRQASALLDVEEPLQHRYTLEVSSPGMDRKLYSESDFSQFAGSRVKVRMAPAYRGPSNVVGELLGFDGGCVRVNEESGEIVELPLADVSEARLQVEWEAVMKKGNSRR